MKKFILPSIFAFGLLFSCNNDDDSSIDNANIVGTWTYVKSQIQYSKDNKIEDEEIADACSSKSTFIYSSDNKYSDEWYYNYQGTCQKDGSDKGKYTITGNKIKYDYEIGDYDLKEIIKLTKNELILKSDYGEDLDKDGKNEIDILVLKR